MKERVYKLPCYDTRKSFYGKAYVEENRYGYYLYSYGTKVARIDTKGKFHRLWDGYSATTMRHVNSFLRHYNFYGVGGKKWWDEQKVVRY